MSQPLILIATLGAAAGAILAERGHVAACEWSSVSARALKRRLALLKRASPNRTRRLIAGAALAGFLASGGLIAYAAEPSAPQQLPKEVVGVIGSGDALSLQVKAPDTPAPRTIKVGEEYKDGWKLQALTDSTATLSKDGTVQAVGLNPTGTVAAADIAADPSAVSVLGSQTDNPKLFAFRGPNVPANPAAFARLAWSQSLRAQGIKPIDIQPADSAGRYAITIRSPTDDTLNLNLRKGESQVVGTGDQAITATLSDVNVPITPGADAVTITITGARSEVIQSIVGDFGVLNPSPIVLRATR